VRLTKLELQGFKSFADSTEMVFNAGVTAIVGPNGCGKSNVSDAVRWVLGEQRARLLRGQKMEEVIFQGSTARRPVNIAEVSLHFSNDEGVLPVAFREVVITRRLSRSGESEYLLNRSPCRLRDITDLLHGFGAEFAVLFDDSAVEVRHWNNDGIIEDVATGSAAGTIGAYRLRHGLARGGESFTLNQGRFTGRPSVLRVRPHGSPDHVEAVSVGGDVAFVGHGVIEGVPS